MINRYYKQCFFLIACFFNLLLTPVVSLAADIDIAISKDKQEVYQHKNALKRIAVADPTIASVTLLSPKSILITAKVEGVTQISLWETAQPGQPSAIINLIVNKSNTLEKSALKILGKDHLDIKSAGSTLMVEGTVDSLESHSQAVSALKQDPKLPIDATQANFDSHVQIDIKVVEVSRKNMMRFGLFLGKNNQDNPTLAVGAPGTLSGVDGAFTLNSSSGFLPVLNAFNVVIGNKGSGLLGTLSILESNGFAYTLAEPSLSAISGQTANFLAGGEFPVPIKSGSGADSSVTILYKEYGVRLMLTPVVLDNNRIFMKVSPEVSELDFANAVQSGGVSVPGLRVRRTDTSVSLGDGESFVISGMVSRNAINNVDQIPGLGSLPIIGPFFQSKRFDREDKELLMVVTPRLVKPISRDAKLPELPGKEYSDYKPSFSEFFFSNGPKPSTGMSN
jgi:pilus assembly protein CpaC